MTSEIDFAPLLSRASQLSISPRQAGADAADAVAVRGRSHSGRCGSARSRRPNRPRATMFRCASSSASGWRASRRPRRPTRRRWPSARSPWRRSRPRIPIRALPIRRCWPGTIRDLDLFDATEVSADQLKEAALAAEAAALAVKGVTNSAGSGASAGLGRAGAGHLARLPRPVCRLALLALGQRHCRRGHRHGARL